jgi:serine/threonine protein phosphatase 1
MPRLLTIGDIHGCFTALKTLADYVPIKDDDLLVTLGDYVDRGPNSREVLDWLIARYDRGRLIPLRGNHEIMMLEARDGEASLQFWLDVGGREALASYAPPGETGRLSHVPLRHWQFLEGQTRRYYETQTHFFVHANALPDWKLDDQPDDVLFWEKFRSPPPHGSGKTMICGHTPQVSRRPLDIGHAICIDTWVYGMGWLTCLDPVTREYWQANEQGETRRDVLESP